MPAVLAGAKRPVFVVGPWDPTGADALALRRLAATWGAPILAEPLAGQLGDRLGTGADSAHAWMARLAQRAGLAEARFLGD